MLLEHGIYTAALAVIVAMLYERYTKNDPIIVAGVVWLAMFIPDTDYIVRVSLQYAYPHKFPVIQHGDFHNIFVLTLVTIIGGYLVYRKYGKAKITLLAASTCIFLGFLSHLVEDAFVYKEAYPFLAPFTSKVWDTGFLVATNDIVIKGIPIGSSHVYIVGIMLLSAAIMIRVRVQGFEWLEYYNIIPALVNPVKSMVIQVAHNTGLINVFAVAGIVQSNEESDKP